jgi:hypothetical protein
MERDFSPRLGTRGRFPLGTFPPCLLSPNHAPWHEEGLAGVTRAIEVS